ncbi:MAG: peptidoglycan-binding protein [Clostridium sp.]|nr:peptidoglycan-binding protein [Clostridium sp.]
MKGNSRHRKYTIHLKAAGIIALAAMLSGCRETAVSAEGPGTATASEAVIIQVPETIAPLGLEGQVLPNITDVDLGDVEPVPEYLRIGERHEIVKKLQQRLMDLGFMDNDEPTDYYGEMTQMAVKHFQRQNELPMDGIVGNTTWDAIMSPDAKYYAVSKGAQGDDIQRIQQRLYELGYLAAADLVTGNFGDSTEAAVLKLQEVNGLEQDGKVGQKTVNLIYSDEIKANFLSYGEKSDVVLACQQRLRELGYLTTTPDGAYGDDTAVAVRQFQARNDLIVDGYLGPSTRIVLNSSEAKANGLMLGERGDSVKRVQELLKKHGYLSASSVTGYYGEATERAVKNFQDRNGLGVDGLVGLQTMAKLTGDNVRRPAPGSSNTGGGSAGGGSGTGAGGGSSTAPPAQNTAPPVNVPAGSGASALISVASSKLGAPYVWGAKGPNSFDCSGFVYWCLNQVGVNQSYLTSSGWRNAGRYTKITNFNSIQAGDIVVVNGHVGIAAGGGTVIDASSSNGRVVHRSLSQWWANNFICAWRIF